MHAFLAKAVSTLVVHPVWTFLVGLAVILAIIGPFGTYEGLSLPLRLVYWVPIVLAASVFARTANRIGEALCTSDNPLRLQTLSIVSFSLMFSPSVWAYSGLFSETFHSLQSLLYIAANVFCVTAVIGYLVFFITRETEAEQKGVPRLYDRLPEGTEAAIVRLTVDDHYVEVHLDDGSSHRILMRLADAVSEMDDTPGFYTHRSHWVATAFVQDSLRENRRDYLMLETGAKVPVSKTYRDDVQGAGFL